VPVFGLGVAALAFGERVSPLATAGSLLTIAAIGVVARVPVRRAAGQAALQGPPRRA
jgi:drug/metabolite transporter (DMT)-like permease